MKVPILRHGNVLLTSFQDDLTDRDASNLQADLLEMIETTGASAVLMDVTSLETVDSYQAKLITDTAAMARLLGCEVVLSGVRPSVAITLVDLGDVMSGVRTVLNLETGMALLSEAVSEKDRDEDEEDLDGIEPLEEEAEELLPVEPPVETILTGVE